MQHCTVSNCKNKSYRHYELCQKHKKDISINKYSIGYKKLLRKAIIKGNIAYIPLGGKRSGYVIVDKNNSILDKHLWVQGSNGYATTSIKGVNMLMHKLIVNPKKNYVIDHINRNKLDNRSNNLRQVPQIINVRNSGINKNNTSKVNGVSWSKANSKWESYITYNYKRKHLGLFSKLEDAIKARKTAELKYWS